MGKAQEILHPPLCRFRVEAISKQGSCGKGNGTGTFTTFGAWTEAQENAVKPMLFVLDDAASSINGVQTTVKAQSNVRYNIAGQRVAADYKGIVIINGKKYLQK